MTNSYLESKQTKYFKNLFELLEITPEINHEALQTLQQKEVELGIKFPSALKECLGYFDTRSIKDDPSIYYENDDHHPTSSSIIRRMQALYRMDWDLCHFIEKEAKKEKGDKEIESILRFWTDSNGTCSFYIGLDGSENPPIYDYGVEYGIEDDYETLLRVSNHFTDFIILMFFNLIRFKHKIICSTKELFTQNQLDSLKQLFPTVLTLGTPQLVSSFLSV